MLVLVLVAFGAGLVPVLTVPTLVPPPGVAPGAVAPPAVAPGVAAPGAVVPGAVVVGTAGLPSAGAVAAGAVVRVLVTRVVVESELPARSTSAAVNTPSESATRATIAAIGLLQLGVAARRVRAAAPQRRHHSCWG
jgi:hypothetical protein